MKSLEPGVFVTPQIQPEDVAVLSERGVRLIVNNRPDGEEPGQPAGQSIARAAAQAGVAYVAIPVTGLPTPEQSAAVRDALKKRSGDALMFCRSGMRSTAAWAIGTTAGGERPVDEVRQAAADAGYDLSRLPL